MNVGDLLLWGAGLSVLIALGLYGRSSGQPSHRNVAGSMILAHLILLTAALGLLLYFFLSNQYQFQYVAHNSSRDLPLFYKISAVWAGQEGTFLLWVWLAAIMGLFVARRGGDLLRPTMIYFLLTQLFLLTLLYVRSPFLHVPGAVPADGNGLNPLLKDPWMVIHPPIVFVGYAAFAIPFCYTLAALSMRRWDTLAATIFPWAAFAAATLGAGLFIGGFWAYEVLGWGGYWGWDPVENASLVPWLTALALLHALLIYRIRGQLARTTIALSIISYVLVVYGTFLTRSGVLADFSVHSFTDLGINTYLTSYLIGVTALSLAFFIIRTRRLPSPPISKSVNSREFGLVTSILLFCLLAGFVLIGTSSPILTGLGGTPSNVTSTYYNRIALPLGLFIALVLGFSPFLLFERIPWGELFRLAAPSFVAAGALTVAVVLVTPITLLHATLVFTATLALTSNLIAIIRFGRGLPLRMSGHLTHFGFAILVLGIIASSAYSTEERLTVQTGGHVSAYGYDIEFVGAEQRPKAEEGYLNLILSKGNDAWRARPKLYVSDYTHQVMRTPSVKKSLLYDLYIAPMDHESAQADSGVYTLSRGQTTRYGDWDLTFLRYELGQHDQAGAMRVGAVIQAVRERDTVLFVPAVEFAAQERHTFPTELPGTNLTFTLAAVSVESRSVSLKIDDPSSPSPAVHSETLVLSVSRKPLTSFVWAGSIIVTIGSCLSFWRRRKELALLA